MAEPIYTNEQLALKLAVESKETTYTSVESVLRYAETYLKWLKSKSNENAERN